MGWPQFPSAGPTIDKKLSETLGTVNLVCPGQKDQKRDATEHHCSSLTLSI